MSFGYAIFRRRKRCAAAIAAAAISIAAGSTSKAQTQSIPWLGVVSGDWSNASNWGGGVVPNLPGFLTTFQSQSNPITSINIVGTYDSYGISTAWQVYTFSLSGSGSTFSFYGDGIVAAAPTVFNVGAGATLNFLNSASAFASGVGSVSLVNSGLISFQGTSTASTATITTNSGGVLEFLGNSTAASARLIANANATVDFTGTQGPAGNGAVTAGSIEGAGTIYIGNVTLSVGSNNLSTEVSGVIAQQCALCAPTLSGNLIKVGTGTLILSGNSTFSGTTTISAGILQLGNGGVTGSVSGNIINNAILSLNRSDDFTFSNLVSGSGDLQKNGNGNVTISAANTYVGLTLVNSGTLTVTGSIANSAGVTVNNGGTLAGSGAVPGVTINTGGTLAPIGTLNVGGNTTMNSGSTYAINVTPTSADQIVATGSANLTGATLRATYATGTYIDRNYVILTAQGGLGGTTFATLNNVNLPAGFTASLNYTSSSVELVLALTMGNPGNGNNGNNNSTSNLPSNLQGPANAMVDFFNNGGSLPSGFVAVSGMSGEQQRAAFAQLSGQPQAFFASALFHSSHHFTGTLFDQLVPTTTNRRIAVADEPLAYTGSIRRRADPWNELRVNGNRRGENEYPLRLSNAPEAPGVWSAWNAVYGGANRIDGSASGTYATRGSLYGLMAGADYRVRDMQMGFALNGSQFNYRVTDGLGAGNSDQMNVAVYGRYSFGAPYLATAFSYGLNKVTLDRTVTLNGVDQLQAQFDAHTLAGRLEAGYRIVLNPGFRLTPYTALQPTMLMLPSYGETALQGSNQYALSVNAQNVTNLRTEIGVRNEIPFVMDGGTLVLRSKLAWNYDTNSDPRMAASFQALPGSNFTVAAASASPITYLGAVGGEIRWNGGWALGANVNGELSDALQSFAAKAFLRATW